MAVHIVNDEKRGTDNRTSDDSTSKVKTYVFCDSKFSFNSLICINLCTSIILGEI